jgi:hypothetical protein
MIEVVATNGMLDSAAYILHKLLIQNVVVYFHTSHNVYYDKSLITVGVGPVVSQTHMRVRPNSQEARVGRLMLKVVVTAVVIF